MTKKSQKKILVVDDSLDQQILLRRLLETNGFTIECTSNGDEALSLLSSCRVLPQVIMLDLNMPTMDGMTFLAHRSHDSRIKNIPIVIMSGEENPLISQVLSDKISILAKPFNVAAVLNKIQQTFSTLSSQGKLV